MQANSEQFTYQKPNGEWGIAGVDLFTLPPRVYRALCKLHDLEHGNVVVVVGGGPACIPTPGEGGRGGSPVSLVGGTDKPPTAGTIQPYLMKRLTTDHPMENFETLLNYVFSKDGWVHIRHDGIRDNVPLTEWAMRQCRLRGCEEAPGESPEEIDQKVCDCMLDNPECPVALAYCFGCQASHLRDRLKMHEDWEDGGAGR